MRTAQYFKKKAGEVVVWGSLGSETRTFYHRHHSGRGRLLFLGGRGEGEKLRADSKRCSFSCLLSILFKGEDAPPIPPPVCV